MSKIQLSNVTLLGIDCVDVSRLQEAMDISESGISFGASKLLTSLPTLDPRRVEIPQLATVEAYSDFCIRDLYKYVDTEFVLLVQYDGFVLNPASWKPEFQDYDYIGAPWFVNRTLIDEYGFPKNLRGTFVVGNGGFSFRSKKLLETSARLANEGKLLKIHPEDNAICVFHKDLFENAGLKIAPPEIGLKFSIEGGNKVFYDNQFGFHSFRWTNIDAWINKHPEYPIAVSNYKKLSEKREGFFGKLLRWW